MGLTLGRSHCVRAHSAATNHVRIFHTNKFKYNAFVHKHDMRLTHDHLRHVLSRDSSPFYLFMLKSEMIRVPKK